MGIGGIILIILGVIFVLLDIGGEAEVKYEGMDVVASAGIILVIVGVILSFGFNI